MRIKKAFVWSILLYLIPTYAWRVALLKPLVLPFLLFFVLRKVKQFWLPLIFASFLILLYFVFHGYSGTHDLKIFLLYLHLLLPHYLIEMSRERRSSNLSDFMHYSITMLLLSLFFIGQDFVINLGVEETERFRGFYPFPFFALMLASFTGSRRAAFLLTVFVSLAGFLISGERSGSIVLLLFGLVLATRKAGLSYLMILILPSVPLLLMLYQSAFPQTELHNLTVRALTVDSILDSLSAFGNGISPPISILRASSEHDHFFVPADVVYLGQLFELGWVTFTLKTGYILFLMARVSSGARNRLVLVGISYVAFGYNLTYDVSVLAASILLYNSLPQKKDEHSGPGTAMA